MEGWKTYRLEDLTIDGKGHYGIGAPAVDFDENKFTYLRITDINDDGSINYSGLKSVDDPDAKKYILKEGDIVFARTGNSTGRSYYYESSDGQFVFAGFLIKFSLDPAKVNPRFLKYYTHSKAYYEWVQSFDTGATRGNINAQTYGSMEIKLPPRAVQNRLVEILSSMDDKIKLNNRINHNLEDCLFSLYIRLLENQCGSSTIGQVSERIYSGGTPDTKNSDFWGGAINWLSSGETSERFIIDTEKRITENGVRHSSTKYASKYDVVIASAGQGNTRGQTSMTLLNTCINQSVIVIHANSVEAPAIFCSLANRYDELRAISDASSIRGSLTTKMISALEIPIFPEVESVKFSSQAMCLIDQIENNLRENRSLKEQRDTLLPKLMGGGLCK